MPACRGIVDCGIAQGIEYVLVFLFAPFGWSIDDISTTAHECVEHGGKQKEFHPLAVDVTYLAFHGSSIFAFTGTRLFFSPFYALHGICYQFKAIGKILVGLLPYCPVPRHFLAVEGTRIFEML